MELEPIESTKCYSITDDDDESYTMTSFEDLIDVLEDNEMLGIGAVYYEASCTKLSPQYVVDHANVLGWLDDWLYDEIGEVADNDFSNVTPAARAEFNKLLIGWMDKYTNVAGYGVISETAVKKQITKEDIEKYAKGKMLFVINQSTE